MGLTDLFSKNKDEEKPKTEMPKIDLPESKQENDLKRLKEFEDRIMMRGQSASSINKDKEHQFSQEEMALKLKNPFRGV